MDVLVIWIYNIEFFLNFAKLYFNCLKIKILCEEFYKNFYKPLPSLSVSSFFTK